MNGPLSICYIIINSRLLSDFPIPSVAMNAFFTFALLCIFALLLSGNISVAVRLTESIFASLFGWMFQRVSLETLLMCLKKTVRALQVCFVVVELIGFIGFVSAINSGNFAFAVILVWIGFAEKTILFFCKKPHRLYYSLTMTILKIGLSLYFNNSLNVFANTCKVIALFVLDKFLAKIKATLLKSAFFSLLENKQVDENSLQSSVVDFVRETYHRLCGDDANVTKIGEVIDVLHKQITTIIEKIELDTHAFSHDMNSLTNRLYIFKLCGGFFILVFLLLVGDAHVSNGFVLSSIFMKVLEYVFGPVTPLNSMMENMFLILRTTCCKITQACLSLQVTTSIFSIARTMFS